VREFDRRFEAEDGGWVDPEERAFRWSMLDGDLQKRLF
jgi:hypothetical protein